MLAILLFSVQYYHTFISLYSIQIAFNCILFNAVLLYLYILQSTLSEILTTVSFLMQYSYNLIAYIALLTMLQL